MGKIGKIIFDQKQPSKGLFNVVLLKIEEEKVKSARKSTFVFGFVSIFSLISVAETVIYLVSEFKRTGFYDYASLLVSDWNSIVFFWKEVLVSMGESLPVFGLVVLFTTVVVFLESFKYTINNLLNIMMPKFNRI